MGDICNSTIIACSKIELHKLNCSYIMALLTHLQNRSEKFKYRSDENHSPYIINLLF